MDERSHWDFGWDREAAIGLVAAICGLAALWTNHGLVSLGWFGMAIALGVKARWKQRRRLSRLLDETDPHDFLS